MANFLRFIPLKSKSGSNSYSDENYDFIAKNTLRPKIKKEEKIMIKYRERSSKLENTKSTCM